MKLEQKIKTIKELKSYDPNFVIGTIVFLALLNERRLAFYYHSSTSMSITKYKHPNCIKQLVPVDHFNGCRSDILLSVENYQVRRLVAYLSVYKTVIFWKQNKRILDYKDISDIFHNPESYVTIFFNKEKNIYKFKKLSKTILEV